MPCWLERKVAITIRDGPRTAATGRHSDTAGERGAEAGGAGGAQRRGYRRGEAAWPLRGAAGETWPQHPAVLHLGQHAAVVPHNGLHGMSLSDVLVTLLRCSLIRLTDPSKPRHGDKR